MDFQIVTHSDLLYLRDLIADNPIALERWPVVVDHIVEKPADRRRIRQILDNCKFEAAILTSLGLWREHGEKRANLSEVLLRLGLNSLAEKIVAEFGLGLVGTVPVTATDQGHVAETRNTRESLTPKPRVSKSVLVLVCTGASFCLLAMVSLSYLSSNTASLKPRGSPSPNSCHSHGVHDDEHLKLIRDLVLNDHTALQKWGMVVDYIVSSPADELRIKSPIKRGDFEEAVLGSLRVWNAAGDERTDLVKLLRDLGLPACRATQRTCTAMSDGVNIHLIQLRWTKTIKKEAKSINKSTRQVLKCVPMGFL